jgi:hypothetical protein
MCLVPESEHGPIRSGAPENMKAETTESVAFHRRLFATLIPWLTRSKLVSSKHCPRYSAPQPRDPRFLAEGFLGIADFFCGSTLQRNVNSGCVNQNRGQPEVRTIVNESSRSNFNAPGATGLSRAPALQLNSRRLRKGLRRHALVGVHGDSRSLMVAPSYRLLEKNQQLRARSEKDSEKKKTPR